MVPGVTGSHRWETPTGRCWPPAQVTQPQVLTPGSNLVTPPGTPAPSPAAWPPLPAHTWALAVLTPARYRLKAILIALNSVDKNTLSENQK